MSIEILNKIKNDHTAMIAYGLQSINFRHFHNVASLIVLTIMNGNRIYTIGNGASASIAQHWSCDYTKGCSQKEKNFQPQVISLASNIPLMTAISNDISYEEVYSYQLDKLANKNDLLIAISSSGNSPNIVKAIEEAKNLGVKTVSLTGMTGGKAKELADENIHVDVHEYEATEDCHQAIMHMIAKYLRMF